jgi:hypothetical protein
VLRVSDNATFDGLDADESLITKAESFAKSDTASQIISTAKGFLSKKKDAPTGLMVPPGTNPFTVAPTSINWMGVILPVAGGVLGLSILAWALLRKR